MQVRWLACSMSSIGLTAPKELVDLAEAAAEYRFDLKRLKGSEYARLVNVVERGYIQEETGLTSTLLKLLAAAHQADETRYPAVPKISYVGKRALTIYTLEGRERAIADELIAFGQMTDAAFPKRAVHTRKMAVCISSWDTETKAGLSHRERKAARLKSNFVGITALVNRWCSETLDERKPLLKYLSTSPTIAIRLIYKKEKANAS